MLWCSLHLQPTCIGSKLNMTLQGQYFEIPISKCNLFLHEHLPSYKWKEYKETVQKSGTVMHVNIEYFDITNVKAINISNI
jgi:hypothetical protein